MFGFYAINARELYSLSIGRNARFFLSVTVLKKYGPFENGERSVAFYLDISQALVFCTE